MKQLLETTKDFKVIPENFKSSGELEIIEIKEDSIKAKLTLVEDGNLEDYIAGSNIEVFGVNDLGLIYFETKLLERQEDIITFEIVQDYSIIQRREYSRVLLDKGKVTFKDLAQDAIIKIEDISAGGLKLVSGVPLEFEKYYSIEIALSNNMKINCTFQPIRITDTEDGKFLVSGKFLDLESMDRIVLVQYAFKIKMEEQNKEQ